MRCARVVGVLVFFSALARARGRLTIAPLKDSPVDLPSFTVDCVIEFQAYGPQTCHFPEKVRVKHATSDICYKDSAEEFSDSILINARHTIGDVCPNMPNTMLDEDIVRRYEVYESANVSYILGFGGQYKPGALYKIKFSGWESSSFGLIICSIPKGYDWNSIVDPFLNTSAAFTINGTCDTNEWENVIGSWLYSLYFGVLIPLAFGGVALVAFGCIVKFASAKRTINLFLGSGRTKLTVILLIIEGTACLLLIQPAVYLDFVEAFIVCYKVAVVQKIAVFLAFFQT